METIAQEICPICGNQGTAYKSDKRNGYSVSVDKCGTCGTIYQNPRLTREALAEFYASGKYDEVFDGGVSSGRPRADRLSAFINGFRLSPTRCLDIGCGSGYLLRNLHEDYGAEVVGYDLFPPRRPVIDTITSSKEEVTGKFDLITCIHVLEHVYDPMEEVLWMASLLKPGGTLMIEVPMVEKIYLPHIFIFSKKALNMMFEATGLEYFPIDLPSLACDNKIVVQSFIALLGDGYSKYTAGPAEGMSQVIPTENYWVHQ